VALSIGRKKKKTSDDYLFMDIQSTAALMDNLHPVPPLNYSSFIEELPTGARYERVSPSCLAFQPATDDGT
jgi:hypothetical protein